MKALFTYDYGQEKMDMIRELGYEITYVHESKVENTIHTDDAEILVCYNPFQRIDIKRMKRLKWIQLSSIGFDQVPLEDVLKQNIAVTNNRGGYSKPMGEWIVLNLLEIFKKRKAIYKEQEEKVWHMRSDIFEIVGKKIAFLGTGTISQEGAKRLQGFEAELIGFNTNGHEAPYFNACYPLDTIKDHLPQMDAVVVVLPHTEETHHFVDKELIASMKAGVTLINVSRGGNIDETALIDALKHDKFLGVALDVFETEPLPMDSPLWTMDRVYFSPHNSWVSEMKNQRRFDMIYDNMKRYINGEALNNIVDLNRGY